MKKPLKHGDFSGLAEDYSRYRPGYAPAVLKAIIGLLGRDTADCDAADVGAGTGIWTRMLAATGLRSVRAVEPNADMRHHGELDSENHGIEWLEGSGESTGLDTGSLDLVTMASSFHWVDFERGTREFARVLKPSGWFVALWNPRLIEANPLLVEIEAHLDTLKPDIRRVSSGRSGLTETLTSQLETSPLFGDVLYLEGKHRVRLSPEHYLGAWRSVNDLQVQLGAEKFDAFLDYVSQRIRDLPYIEATYLTRAWAAQRL